MKKTENLIIGKLTHLLEMRRERLKKKRFIELDLFRGLAIVLMIFGHILWDLDYFGVIPMNNGIYSGLQKTVPPMFFLIVGMGLIVSRKKKELTPEGEKKYYKRLMMRGVKIIGLGIILTLISILFIPDKPVFFGVLHCIGLSIILSVPFLKYRQYNLIFATTMILAGLWFTQLNIQNPTLAHLIFGLRPAEIWSMTVDYFPLLPWFGVTLLGIAIGDWMYCGDKRRFRMPDLSRYRPAKIFSWIGQHSLEIYLIHQPVIAGTLYLFVRTL